MYFWVSGFHPKTGELYDVGSVDECDDAEQAFHELIDMGYIRDSGFYFASAPNPATGEQNLGIANVNMTTPPEVKVIKERSDIFIGMAHDE